MGEQADLAETRQEGVAIVTVATPSSGVVSPEVRNTLSEHIASAAANPACQAIVITGRDGHFAMGTHLEFGNDTEDGGAPDLATLCDQIEAVEKPVVAAINGPALGNGLELALAAHARVASPSAKLGAPEITIGLVPGGGGTQRLPKVVGGVTALKMLLSGRSVTGVSAAKIGLVDRLVETDVVDAAVAYANALARSDEPLPRSSTRRDRLGEGNAFLESVAEHRNSAVQSALDAPLRMIECIEAALLLPYDIGRGLEAAAFEDLVDSDHSKALRHVFSAERRLATSSRVTGRTPSRPLGAIGLIGARGIGSEIAVACLDAGFSVTVAESNDEALEAGVSRLIEHYDAQVAKGKLKEDTVEDILDRLQAVCGYATLGDVDVVIDPGPGIARSRVAELDAVMKAGAIFATGSEQVDIATVAAATKRPGDVVGFKLYPGMRTNRLAEIIPSAATAPRALATARVLAQKLDRLVVQAGAGESLGIGVRITDALHAAADLCALDGARIGQVDDALQDWGVPQGSFGWRDAQGLSRSRRKIAEQDLSGRLADAGRAGRMSGRGFYAYGQRGGKGIEDPDVVALIEAERREKGITARVMNDGEVKKRCLAAMAGAGAQMLTDGTARSPADIDMVAIHGLGFARRTGGVMFAADLLGLAEVRQLILEMSQRTPHVSPPSPVFQDLIKAGKGFAALGS